MAVMNTLMQIALAAITGLLLLDGVWSQSLCNDCIVTPDASTRWRSGETRTIVWRATSARTVSLFLVNASEVGVHPEDETIILRGVLLFHGVALLNASTVQVIGENRFVWDIPPGLDGSVPNAAILVDDREDVEDVIVGETFTLRQDSGTEEALLSPQGGDLIVLPFNRTGQLDLVPGSYFNITWKNLLPDTFNYTIELAYTTSPTSFPFFTSRIFPAPVLNTSAGHSTNHVLVYGQTVVLQQGWRLVLVATSRSTGQLSIATWTDPLLIPYIILDAVTATLQPSQPIPVNSTVYSVPGLMEMHLFQAPDSIYPIETFTQPNITMPLTFQAPRVSSGTYEVRMRSLSLTALPVASSQGFITIINSFELNATSETWSRCDDVTISWTTVNSGSTRIQLYYRHLNNESEHVLDLGDSVSTSLQWTVPEQTTLGNGYFYRVRNVADLDLYTDSIAHT
eukprot:m.282997 g.282997  ORF g.282997 m.282997 type:complete len:454 (+) comp17756_c0_seq1:77-1438(+)